MAVQQILDCLLQGLSRAVLNRVCQSERRYPLLAMRSDTTVTSPVMEDFEEHQIVVERVIEAFPQRCPSEKLFISAFMLLDEHYGYKLSKLKPEQVFLGFLVVKHCGRVGGLGCGSWSA